MGSRVRGCGPHLINHSMEVRSQGTVSTYVSCHTVSTSKGMPTRQKGSARGDLCTFWRRDTPPGASHLWTDRRTGLVVIQEYKMASHEHIHVCAYACISVCDTCV